MQHRWRDGQVIAVLNMILVHVCMTYFVRTDLKRRVRNYEGYVGDRTHKLAIPETQFSVKLFLDSQLFVLWTGKVASMTGERRN